MVIWTRCAIGSSVLTTSAMTSVASTGSVDTEIRPASMRERSRLSSMRPAGARHRAALLQALELPLVEWAPPIALEQLCESQDRIERRPQLVAH
jgi:hypothetical protein